MTETTKVPFDHVKAHAHLSGLDKRLARLIEKTGTFHFKLDTCDSVYESLLEAITHQSISGKAAADGVPRRSRFWRRRIWLCAKRGYRMQKPRR